MERMESNLKIGAFLSKGHFGEVHLGTDDIHGQVAIKIFRQQPGENVVMWTSRKEVLLSEGQKLKQSTHPHVVQVFHLVEAPADDAIHLTMEFCSGGSLKADFDNGPMSLRNVKRHITQVARGLQALHDRGMLHRDIKPANILIDQHGVTKLADFGFVTDNLILGYGSVVGYNDHLAPEVHSGYATSVKTDIWALGMTVYRLLHGAMWYAKSPPPQTLIPSGGFAQNLQWLPHIPKTWRSFVRKALRDDPGRRFQTVTDMMNALAPLAATPEWECSVGSPLISWERQTHDRHIEVAWRANSQRRHEWSAWSAPLKIGRRRALGGSSGIVSSSAAQAGLETFFATHV